MKFQKFTDEDVYQQNNVFDTFGMASMPIPPLFGDCFNDNSLALIIKTIL